MTRNHRDRFCPDCNLTLKHRMIDGVQRYVCVQGCQKAWTRYRVSFDDEKDKERLRGNKWMKKQRDAIKEYIDKAKSVPCSDCRKTFPSVCMDFDHINGEKSFNISSFRRSWYSYSDVLKKIDEEISKCEIVCSNCHRIRTQRRIEGCD